MTPQQDPNRGPWFGRSRRNMAVFGALAVGVPSACFLVYSFHRSGGIGFSLFVAVVSILGGWVWGFVMWHAFLVPFRRRLMKYRKLASHQD
ncbi:MAG: hypothetical protein ACT4PZ_06465 [Panacagrimonas sp.]